MKAIAINPGNPRAFLVERKEPDITSPDDVKVRIIRVGICGTDREEISGGRARAPEGSKELVIGHEMLGQVVEIGKMVHRVAVGDLAVFTVRRGCGRCLPCEMNRPDMCKTGQYKERGIWGLDGYQTEYVVDKEQYVVRVPRELEPIAVLCEPLSVAKKAIYEAVIVQSVRLPAAASTPDWLNNRRCLVAGLGPIGLLAALALKIAMADVYGLDIVPKDSPRAQWLEKIGGHYINDKEIPPDRVMEKLGPMDLIVEAAGVPSLAFNLLDALNTNGVYVLTGIPGGDRPVQISGPELLRRLVLNNLLMVGSVNAARDHFQMAVKDLEYAHLHWKEHIGKLITNKHAFKDFESALSRHEENEIKTVIEWGKLEKATIKERRAEEVRR